MYRRGARSPVAVRPALPTLTAVLAALLFAAPLIVIPASAVPPSAPVFPTLPAPSPPRTAVVPPAPAVLPSPPPGAPHLLLDVNAAPATDPSAEVVVLEVFGDGLGLFAATDPRHGREPWVTDGTAAGTVRLADLVPGPEGSLESAPPSASGGGRAFFLTGSTGGSGERGLWVTDGTAAGTRRLVDGLLSGPGRREDLLRTDGAGRAFLLASDRQAVPGLWVTDGTVAGTRRLPHPGLPGLRSGELVGGIGAGPGARMLFVAGTGIGGTQELWGSDGTAAGTRRLLPGAVAGPPYEDLISRSPRLALHVAVLDGGTAVVLQESGREGTAGGVALAPWRTDGTPEGTHRDGVLSGRILVPGSLVGGERAGFLTRSTDGPPFEVWLSDGTGSFATRVVHHGDASAWDLHWLDGRLLFTTEDPDVATAGVVLWMADPWAGPALPVARLPGAVVHPPVPFRGGVALLVERQDQVQELWWSDGTADGTWRVAELGRRFGASALLGAYPLAGEEILFLQVSREEAVWELWSSDGTAAGTRRLVPGFPNPLATRSGVPSTLPVRAGVLFGADEGVHGREPWITDGTPEGTRLLTQVAAPAGTGDSWPRGFTRHGDRLLFFARDSGGWGLWTTDGTGAATRLLLRVPFTPPPGPDDPAFLGPEPLAVHGDRLFFGVPAEDPFELVLEVADLATEQVRSLGTFPRGGRWPPEPAGVVGGLLLWAEHDQRVVVSDGTVAGTRSLDLWFTGSVEAFAVLPGGPALLAGELRRADGVPVEPGLWRTDGTPAGTWNLLEARGPFLPNDLTPLPDGTAFFSYGGDDAVTLDRAGLWRTDGTAAGTELLETYGGLLPSRLAAAERGLFFALSGQGGTVLRLWPTGAQESHPVLAEPPEGVALDWVDWTVPFGGGILFAAHDALHGTEPWVSDGTAAGTRLLGDLVVPVGASILVEDLATGVWDVTPTPPVVGVGQAFYRRGGRLWRTDGTREGTFAVFGRRFGEAAGATALEVLALAGERLVFAAHDFDTGREPWVLSIREPAPLPSDPSPLPPPAPTGLTAGSGSDGVFLRWTEPAWGTGLFRVEARSPADPVFRTVHEGRWVGGPGSRNGVRIEGLPPGIPHDFRVRLVNGAGVSPPSGEATASILAAPVASCRPSPTELCLLDGRFQVSAWWRDPRTGSFGRGRAEPFPGSDLTGTFWFFRDGNVELVVKALDGTPVNRRWWLFTGVLTDVEYWLRAVDTEVEEGAGLPGPVEWYHHHPGSLCGSTDTEAFPGVPGDAFPLASARSVAAAEPPPTALDLLGGRYRVRAYWRDPRTGATGVGRAVPGSDNTGYFWFFREGNVELVAKVLDGTPVNGYHWVFYGSLTDVEYDLRVVDLETGEERIYHNPPGNVCGGADTAAFVAGLP